MGTGTAPIPATCPFSLALRPGLDAVLSEGFQRLPGGSWYQTAAAAALTVPVIAEVTVTVAMTVTVLATTLQPPATARWRWPPWHPSARRVFAPHDGQTCTQVLLPPTHLVRLDTLVRNVGSQCLLPVSHLALLPPPFPSHPNIHLPMPATHCELCARRGVKRPHIKFHIFAHKTCVRRQLRCVFRGHRFMLAVLRQGFAACLLSSSLPPPPHHPSFADP
jgi:hypothetical protein